MQVVLNQNIKTLGFRGEVVNVKRGYFRNYLFPNNLADVATESRLKVAESRKEKQVMAKDQLMKNASEVLEKLKDLKVTVKEKANEKGHLYAAVSTMEVIEAVEKKAKITLDKEFLQMDHIKEVGSYPVKVKIGEGKEAEITVVVKAA